jgi:hypothetical protein
MPSKQFDGYKFHFYSADKLVDGVALHYILSSIPAMSVLESAA